MIHLVVRERVPRSLEQDVVVKPCHCLPASAGVAGPVI
jgi:hypothetical protein